MKGLLCVLISVYSVFQAAADECKDVDQSACRVFLVKDPSMCKNQCLSKLCQNTCGICPLTCFHCDNVARPEDCTKKIQCDTIGEVCIATQRYSFGLQQPVFSSGCVNRQVCNTLFGSSRKRSYALHGGCCNSSLCNIHDPDVNITSDVTDDAKSTIYDEILTNIRQDSDNPAPAITRRDPATDPNQCSDLDKDNVACGMLVQSTPDVCKDDCIGRIICPITCGTCVHCKNCMDIDDINKCTNITLCSKTQSCFAKETLRGDFTIGHDLQCMDDFICHAYFGGITSVSRKRQFGGSMRLSGMCCKKDMCNANGVIRPTTGPGGK